MLKAAHHLCVSVQSAQRRARIMFAMDRYERITTVLYTIAVVMIVLWLLGLLTAYTFGGFIHILLGIALTVVLFRVIEGRRPL
jgi:hypothetical protein